MANGEYFRPAPAKRNNAATLGWLLGGVALVSALFWKGTQRVKPAPADLHGGYPAAYTKAYESVRSCAATVPSDPAERARIAAAPVESVVTRGFVLVSKDSIRGADAVERDSGGVWSTVLVNDHAAAMGDEVAHEIGHAFGWRFPVLRADSLTKPKPQQHDHAGAFFRRCITYDPDGQ